MMDRIENVPLIGETEKAVHFTPEQQHFPEALGAQIGIDSPGCDDAAPAAFTQQVIGLLHEELVEVGVRPHFLSVDLARLILEVRSPAEIVGLMGIDGQVRDPRFTYSGVLQKLGLLGFEVMDGHVVLADQIRVLLEKLLGIRLESFPRRVGDDHVEAAALAVQNPVEHVAPMEGAQGANVGGLELPLGRFPQFALLRIPGGLFVLDPEPAKLFQQDFIEGRFRVLLHFPDVVAQSPQVVRVAGRMAVGLDQTVLFLEQIAVGLLEQVALLVPAVELLVIHSHQPEQGVAGKDVEVDIRQWLKLIDIVG